MTERFWICKNCGGKAVAQDLVNFSIADIEGVWCEQCTREKLKLFEEDYSGSVTQIMFNVSLHGMDTTGYPKFQKMSEPYLKQKSVESAQSAVKK